jgi:hypothetical protein
MLGHFHRSLTGSPNAVAAAFDANNAADWLGLI